MRKEGGDFLLQIIGLCRLGGAAGTEVGAQVIVEMDFK